MKGGVVMEHVKSVPYTMGNFVRGAVIHQDQEVGLPRLFADFIESLKEVHEVLLRPRIHRNDHSQHQTTVHLVAYTPIHLQRVPTATANQLIFDIECGSASEYYRGRCRARRGVGVHRPKRAPAERSRPRHANLANAD